jgi:Domain of unknown function (DUF4202)
MQEFQPANRERFERALRRFDQENAGDPNPGPAGGGRPRELVYAQWLSDWVLRLCPEASEELRLAARCQHLCRWLVPRQSYPMTRAGYLRWREELKKLHARKAGELLREAGYPDAVVTRVQRLNRKQDFPQDPESRVLEDALCLVFLERQLAGLAQKCSEEKVIHALQQAWNKMTPAAQAAALELEFGARERELLGKALPAAVAGPAGRPPG